MARLDVEVPGTTFHSLGVSQTRAWGTDRAEDVGDGSGERVRARRQAHMRECVSEGDTGLGTFAPHGDY